MSASRSGLAHAKTARSLLDCCDNAAGAKIPKNEKDCKLFRAFLAKHIKSCTQIPEVAHSLAAIHVPEKDQQIAQRSGSDKPIFDSLARHVQVFTYADEITMEIIKAVLPFLNTILFVSVGSRNDQLGALLGRAEPEVPAVYHFATMDVTSCSTYSGQLMDAIQHFLKSGGKNVNLNH